MIDKLEESISELKKAVELNPGDPDIYYTFGLTYSKCGMINEAIDAYKQAIELRPFFKEARSNLEILRKKQKKARPNLEIVHKKQKKGGRQ